MVEKNPCQIQQLNKIKVAKKLSTEVGTLVIVISLMLALFFIRLLNNGIPTLVLTYAGSVVVDLLLLVLPMYWIISSVEILQFLKLKVNQFKARAGCS